jgi:hypothetical protein
MLGGVKRVSVSTGRKRVNVNRVIPLSVNIILDLLDVDPIVSDCLHCLSFLGILFRGIRQPKNSPDPHLSRTHTFYTNHLLPPPESLNPGQQLGNFVTLLTYMAHLQVL